MLVIQNGIRCGCSPPGVTLQLTRGNHQINEQLWSSGISALEGCVPCYAGSTSKSDWNQVRKSFLRDVTLELGSGRGDK